MEEKIPNGKETTTPATVRTVPEPGKLVQATRKAQGLTQVGVAGLAGFGNRFVVDLERGKETIQMQKVLDVLDLLGLDVTIRRKGER